MKQTHFGIGLPNGAQTCTSGGIELDEVTASEMQRPSRQQVAAWGKEMSKARKAFTFELLRNRKALMRCATFLERFARKEFRWDYGFDVSQKDVSAINDLRNRLPGAERKLKSVLSNNHACLLDPEDPLIICVAKLQFRILHQVRWYFEIKSEPVCDHKLLVKADKHYRSYVTAKQKIVNSCTLLVIKIANQYRNLGLSTMDLIQDGNVGLLTAAEKFDYSKGFAFSTYAVPWIRQSIGIGLRRSRMIHVPAEKISRISRCEAQLQHDQQVKQSYLCKASALAILAENKISESLFNVYRKRVAFLEQLKSHESDTAVELECSCTEWIDQIDRRLLQAKLEQAISILDDRQRLILELRFGLNNQEVHSLSKAGKKIGITHQRAQQIQAESLKILRKELAKLQDSVIS